MLTRLAAIFTIVILFLFQFAAQADDKKKELMKIYFSFSHPSCKLKVITLDKENQYLEDVLEKKLNERHFKYQYISTTRKLKKGELYLTISKETPKTKAYRDCIVETKLKAAEYDHRTSSEDKTLYKKKVRRAFPRITFKGKERCKRALRDTFLNIPFCKLMKE